MSSSARTANLLGALATAVGDRLDTRPKRHPNENNSSAAALRVIAAHPGCSNDALSRALRRSHPATVRLVDRLAQDGLVERRQGVDRRTVALDLTPAGRSRVRGILDARAAELRAIVDLLSPEQRGQLDAIAATVLPRLVATAVDAVHACRLCDGGTCPPDRCPVHLRAHELMQRPGAGARAGTGDPRRA